MQSNDSERCLFLMDVSQMLPVLSLFGLVTIRSSERSGISALSFVVMLPCHVFSLDLDSFCEFRGGINTLVHVLRATFVSRR